jgi:HEPN domain-containing protein
LQSPDDDVAGQLLARAEDDIALVRASVDVEAIADTIVGFHAQQAAEKLLKAVLAHNRIEYPFTHDLERLLELVESSSAGSPPDSDEVAALTPWAVEFRYGEAPEEELDRVLTFELLERLRTWAQALLD